MKQPSEDLLVFDSGEVPAGIRSAEELPAKLYFRIGEVANLTGLKQHVLRYWETEFPSIAPKKMGSNHRMYRRKDVEFILEIKHLLYEKRFTIEGARKFLDNKPKVASKSARMGKAANGALGASTVAGRVAGTAAGAVPVGAAGAASARPGRSAPPRVSSQPMPVVQSGLFADFEAALSPGEELRRQEWKRELSAIQALLES